MTQLEAHGAALGKTNRTAAVQLSHPARCALRSRAFQWNVCPYASPLILNFPVFFRGDMVQGHASSTEITHLGEPHTSCFQTEFFALKRTNPGFSRKFWVAHLSE